MSGARDHELGLVVAGEEITVAHVLDAFLSGRPATTEAAYRADLRHFQQFTSSPTVQAAAELLLTRSNGAANRLVLAYRAKMQETGSSPATTNRRLSVLRSLVKMARLLGLVTWTVDVTDLPSRSYRDTRGPGPDAVRLLFRAAAEESYPRSVRDVAMLHLLYDLALRAGEVHGLDLADLDLERSRLAVLGKGRTQKEYLTFPPACRTALLEWLEARGPEPGPLFLAFNRGGGGQRLTTNPVNRVEVHRMVRELGATIGKKVWPHGLRHTAITEVIKLAGQNNIGIDEVMQYSRHSKLQTLMIYRDQDRDVQGALATFLSERMRLAVEQES